MRRHCENPALFRSLFKHPYGQDQDTYISTMSGSFSNDPYHRQPTVLKANTLANPVGNSKSKQMKPESLNPKPAEAPRHANLVIRNSES